MDWIGVLKQEVGNVRLLDEKHIYGNAKVFRECTTVVAAVLSCHQNLFLFYAS